VYGATGTIDVTEINPLLGELEGSGSGTASGGTLSGTFTCTDLGNGQGTLEAGSPRGAVGVAMASGSGTVTAPIGFGPFTFEGEIVGDAMTGSFDFTNPSGGKGVAALARKLSPVVSESWGGVKEHYTDR